MSKITWYPKAEDPALAASPKLINWMNKAFILSQALRRICQQLTLKILDQGFAPALAEEYDFISIDSAIEPEVFIRQVLLLGDSHPLSYGRVVIPRACYQRHFSDFSQLASNLIGETLLYHNPKVTRGPFQYGYLPAEDPLVQYIFAAVPELQIQDLWGRRSIFSFYGLPLMVMECFLPNLPEYEP